MNLFLFAMVGMVLADNALGFLLCYELVTLTTYWLVKTNPDAAKQSRLYLVMNHIGMALVLIAFWLLCRESGSLEFAALREHHLAGALASWCFCSASAALVCAPVSCRCTAGCRWPSLSRRPISRR